MEQGIATVAPAMIAAWTLVAVGLSALTVLVYVAIRRRTNPGDLENAVQEFRSLDIEAFRNLVDSDEETFLREHLPPRKFREIKRQRAWAAFIYSWEAGRAAMALAKVGQAAQRSPNPGIAASGRQLSESAFRLRLQTIPACLYLMNAVLLPGRHARSLPTFADQYERTSETLFRIRGFSSAGQELVHSKGA
ncbi:MAG: hypothetical protein ABSB87_00300 [Terriglobales bacterium]